MDKVAFGTRGFIPRLTLIFTAVIIMTVGAKLNAAEPVESWAEYPRPEGVSGLTSIAYGNNIFVAVGTNGTVITSSNGMDWLKVSAGATGGPARVKFVNDRFFALGFAEGPLMSTNGSNWTALGVFFSDITFAEGVYYTVLWDQTGRSTNLVNWTYQTSSNGYRNIAYADGVFVASGGEPGTYYNYSSDAQNWNPGFSVSTGQGSEITVQNGYFSAVVLSSFMMPQLLHEGFPGLPPQYIYVPKWAYGLFISDSGSGWGAAFRLPEGVSAIPRKVATGGPFFVLPAGNSVFYTTNISTTSMLEATNWTQVAVNVTTPENAIADIAYGNNVFVAVMAGKIFKSNPVTGFAPLRILNQPQDFSATLGGTATFSVSAHGSDPISYQWRHQGTNLTGQVDFRLTLTNVTADVAGEYDVVITNPAGSETSEKGLLTVSFADVKLYAGVTLRGQPGDQFQLEYSDQMQAPESWNAITNVTLTTSESIWIDFDSPQGTNRFYRATYLGR